MSSRPQLDRLVAAGLLAVAALATITLVAGSWAAWSAVRGAAATSARGQAETLLADARRTLAQPGQDSRAAQEFLAAQAANGARYVAVIESAIGTDESRVTEAGSAPIARAEMEKQLQAAAPSALLPAGRWLMVLSRPPSVPKPPPGSPAMMPPGLAPLPPAGAPPSPYYGLQPTAPLLLIVFEPLVAERLEAAARRTLALGLVGALALLLATAVVLRWLWVRAELARRREHEGRLVALGEMSAVLAHEIRNPLASLKGHSQLLVELVQEGKPREKAERVVREAVRLEGLVNDLLEFVRSGRIERVPADPAALLRSVADSVDAKRVVFKTEGAPPTFSLDGPRLSQVLINVIRNAIQAQGPEPPPVEAEVRSQGDALCFTVRDHGPGVPPGEEERIFEPFHTTRVRGMGLGLAASRRLVALHGGTITVANHPNGGAVFRILIPRE